MSAGEPPITNENYKRDPPNLASIGDVSITNENYRKDSPNLATAVNNANPASPASPINSTNNVSEPNLSYAHTGSGYWGGSYYPYWSLMLITVLFGFFGVDHFFLRSPRSGLLKAFINIFTLGSWWIYDIIQIFRDKETVLKSGLNIPALGPAGIAAGVFTDRPGSGKEPVKSPWLYLLYLLVAIFPYSLGIDSFIAGDVFGGLFKLTGILIIPLMFILPQKLLEWYRIFVTPDMFFEKGLPRFPGVNYLIGDWGCHNLAPENYEGLCAGGLLGFALNLLPLTTGAIDVALAAPVGAVAAGLSTVKHGVELADEAVKAAQGTLGAVAKAGEAVRQASALAGQAGQAQQAALGVASAAARPAAIQERARGIMVGGSQQTDSLSTAALVLVTSLILGGGLYQGGLRIKQLLKQNGRATRDDAPP
jgi:hypothetical protein